MQEASSRPHQGHRRGVPPLNQSGHVFTRLSPGGLRSPSHNFDYFTLIPGYCNYENRGQTPLLLDALLPFVFALPLLFTLLKFVAFVTAAPRSQKLFAANH